MKSTNLLKSLPRDDAVMASVIASCSARVERYLMRRVLERSFVRLFDSAGGRELLLAEYPVRSVASVRCDPVRAFGDETKLEEAAWYCATVPYDVFEDLPAAVIFDSFLSLPSGSGVVRIEYTAGYPVDRMPEDLKLATAELVAWSLRRVKSKQIGVSGLIPTSGRMERAVLELQMPANVREMLEPYRRRTW